MTKLAILGIVPLFAGGLFAQTNAPSAMTTMKTWNGTLIDANCYTTHTSQQKENTTNPDGSTTTKTVTTVVSACPVTTSTTEFGVVSPSGAYIRFDQPSSDRVVVMVKKHHKWHEYITERKPINVRVVGTPNGNSVVVQDIQ